jgi:ABC-2 type transport system ATP-binding protein
MESDLSVRVRDLCKAYAEVRAVDGVDLDIRRGEIFALLGPNGAGKTTTVEILEGYRRRTSGEVSVLGTDPERGDRAWRSRIGIVLQSNVDASELSVRELIRHFAGYYPNPADPDQVIESVGLTSKAGARLRQLSGGQRRRVDVALGIVGNPELIFLDEPTTGFDPEARRQFWGLIEGLAGGGTTILLTTHYLEEAEALANRAAVIVAGRIRATGAPADLGGRATALATVHWRAPGGRRSVETPAPAKLVADLVAQFGGEVPELTVTRPSLEDVYLRMIDDAAAEAAQATPARPDTRIGVRR